MKPRVCAKCGRWGWGINTKLREGYVCDDWRECEKRQKRIQELINEPKEGDDVSEISLQAMWGH